MIGQRTMTTDSWSKVTAEIRYTIDEETPDTLHVAILRSTEPHARLVRVDASAAADMPGVIATMTARDIEELGIEPYFGPVFRDQPILAADRVLYVGDPVAAVAAVDQRSAEAALEAIEVEYEPLPAVFTPEEALQPDAPLLHDFSEGLGPSYPDIIVQGQEGNICNKFQIRKGRGLAGFDEADHVFEHVFTSPSVQHVSMEPHACLARFDGGRLTVTTSTQTPYAVRDELAHLFNLPTSHVRVIVPPLGGGFGGKTYAKVEPLAAAFALKTGRPAKIVLSREEEFVTNRKHAVTIRIRTGVRNDGTFVARHVEAHYNAGAYTDISPRLIKNGGYAAVGPYKIPHVHVDSYAVYTNLPSAGAFRGYGVSQGSWAHESHMDLIAGQLGIDPVELRRRNLLGEGDTFATGEVIEGAHFREVLDDALTLFDTEAGEPPTGSVRRGRGCAVIIKSTITPSTSAATVKLNVDGSLTVLTSTVEMGQGAHTALGQIAAHHLGLPVTDVRVVTPDTDVTPYDMTTSSSRSTGAMGAAVEEAVADLRAELLGIAAKQLSAGPEELDVRDGQIVRRSDGTPLSPVSEVMRLSRRGTLTGEGYFQSEGGLHPETGQGVASEHWHQGAVAAEVDVDTATGKVHIRRLRASVYAGTVVNPVNARMQVEGSIAFGVSQALFEQLLHDAGHPANANLSEYALAGRHDLPRDMQISLLEGTDGEIHGLGETALPPIAPAIANAVADATGVRVPDLPLTAERVLAGLEDVDDSRD